MNENNRKPVICSLGVGDRYFLLSVACILSVYKHLGDRCMYAIFYTNAPSVEHVAEKLPFIRFHDISVQATALLGKDYNENKSYFLRKLKCIPFVCDEYQKDSLLFLDSDCLCYSKEFIEVFDFLAENSLLACGSYYPQGYMEKYCGVYFDMVAMAEKAGLGELTPLYINSGILGRSGNDVGQYFSQKSYELIKRDIYQFADDTYYNDEPYFSTAYQLTVNQFGLDKENIGIDNKYYAFILPSDYDIIEQGNGKPKVYCHSRGDVASPAVIHFINHHLINYYHNKVQDILCEYNISSTGIAMSGFKKGHSLKQQHQSVNKEGRETADPLFSVILCNYNYSRYIGQAIESVLRQSVDDLELIIVDDGSTDDSIEIIKGYNDPRIRLVFKENGGQASAMNAGMEQARGRFVAFLDSDDLFDLDKLEKVEVHLKNNQYVLVQHPLRVIDENSRQTGECFPPLTPGVHDLLALYAKTRRTNYFSATSGLVALRRTLKNIFPLPEENWKICADVPLSRPLPVFGNVLTMGDAVGSYRIHGENNWMNTPERKENAEEVQRLTTEYTNDYLKYWGIKDRIEIPLPYVLFLKNRVKNIVVYGAGKHTEFLLNQQELKGELCITGIMDDHPVKKHIAGVPVFESTGPGSIQTSCDALLISSDAFEMPMAQKAMKNGWENVYTVYSWKKFKQECEYEMEELRNTLIDRKVKTIALYGGGFHTLNILLSEAVSDVVDIKYILDDNPVASSLNGVPVCTPQEITNADVDAVVISSEVHEKRLYEQACKHGLEKIILIYGPTRFLRRYRADIENIRKEFGAEGNKNVALLGDKYFIHLLIQSGVLHDCIDIQCVLDAAPTADSIMGVPVCDINAETSCDTVIVTASEYEKKLPKTFDGESGKIFTIPKNIDEITLIHRFLQADAVPGTMIDIGANKGASMRPFVRSGWRVYAFEPCSRYVRILKSAFGNNPLVQIETRALSNEMKEHQPFFNSPVSAGISGLSRFHRSHSLAEYVDTITLEHYVRTEEFNADVMFMKIDTEGYDYFVLQGNNWDLLKPRIIMCEYENYKTIPMGYDFHDIADYLVEKQYHVLVSEWDTISEYGNQQRWKRFVKYPCDLLDPEACGNIIAFSGQEDLDTFFAENSACGKSS